MPAGGLTTYDHHLRPLQVRRHTCAAYDDDHRPTLGRVTCAWMVWGTATAVP